MVKTADALKQALSGDINVHVRLGANITSSGISAGQDFITIRAGAHHILDLNGYTLTHTYVNSARENDGTPIRVDGSLVINGPGAITGGHNALHGGTRESTITINGGIFTGKAAMGILPEGLLIVNEGTVNGRFDQVFLDGGILVDYTGRITRVNHSQRETHAIIRDGVLYGNAVLLQPLSLTNLDIPANSFLSIERGAILEITESLTGKAPSTDRGGLLILNGVATITQHVWYDTPFTVNTLVVTASGQFGLARGAHVTILGNVTNNGEIRIEPGATLTIGGNLVNQGLLFETEEDTLRVEGPISGTGLLDQPQGRNGGTLPNGSETNPRKGLMNTSAEALYALGLFQGVGVDGDGFPSFDLLTPPNRQVAITMLVRLLGKEQEARAGQWHHPFTDVDDWAQPFVGYAYHHQLTSGVSATQFGGKDLVTNYQYLTFLLRALGYNDRNGDFSWDNPVSLKEAIGLAPEAYLDNQQAFVRGDVAILSELLLWQQMKDTELRLIDRLVEQGAVTREAAVQAGFIQHTP